MRHEKKESTTKKRPLKVLEKTPEKITEFAEWMDQDDIGEDLRGWTPTGWVEFPATRREITGEDRPELTQGGEERFLEQEEENLPLNED